MRANRWDPRTVLRVIVKQSQFMEWPRHHSGATSAPFPDDRSQKAPNRMPTFSIAFPPFNFPFPAFTRSEIYQCFRNPVEWDKNPWALVSSTTKLPVMYPEGWNGGSGICRLRRFQPVEGPGSSSSTRGYGGGGRLRRGTAHFGRTLRQFLLNVVLAFAGIGHCCSSGFFRTLSWCLWCKIELVVLIWGSLRRGTAPLVKNLRRPLLNAVPAFATIG